MPPADNRETQCEEDRGAETTDDHCAKDLVEETDGAFGQNPAADQMYGVDESDQPQGRAQQQRESAQGGMVVQQGQQNNEAREAQDGQVEPQQGAAHDEA